MTIIKLKTFEIAVYEKGYPNSSKLAIVIPGRLDTKDYINITSLVNFLASQGYFALSFDPPGTWESPGDIELCTTTNYLKVVDELIEYFGNKPTLLVGNSRGGTIAMLAGSKNFYVTHFISIFSNYGAPKYPAEDSIVNGAIVQYRDLPSGNVKTKEQKVFYLPLNYFKDGEQYNALNDLKHCLKPKLFFYGTQDTTVNPAIIKTAYKESAEPKIIHELGSTHECRFQPEIMEEINQIIGKFLEKYR